jgi:hypothetical protein
MSFLPLLIVAAGIGLWMTVGKAWIALAAVGAFGPGLLREFGVLRDRDEYQVQAARRAGYRAYLIGGSATAAVITLLHLQEGPPRFPAELVTFLLVVLWMTWMFDYVMSYWGPRKTAQRVLLAFGGFWLLFVVLSAFGEADSFLEVLGGLGMGALIVSPFFIGAFAATRWPRPTGVLLLVASAFGLYMFGPRPGPIDWSTQLFTTTVLIVPVLVSGLGLVRDEADEEPA